MYEIRFKTLEEMEKAERLCWPSISDYENLTLKFRDKNVYVYALDIIYISKFSFSHFSDYNTGEIREVMTGIEMAKGLGADQAKAMGFHFYDTPIDLDKMMKDREAKEAKETKETKSKDEKIKQLETNLKEALSLLASYRQRYIDGIEVDVCSSYELLKRNGMIND